ncbi:hypothetical protein Tco_1523605 [Tanacetum coccineum]
MVDLDLIMGRWNELEHVCYWKSYHSHGDQLKKTSIYLRQVKTLKGVTQNKLTSKDQNLLATGRDIVDPYTVGTAGASGIRNWGKLYADPVGTQYLNAEPVSTLTLAELKKKQLAKETDEKEYELVVDRRV